LQKTTFLFLFLASRSGFAFPVPTTPWRGAWWVGDPIGWGNLVADLTDLTVVSRGISPSAGLRWLWCVNSRIKMDQVFMFSPFSILFWSVLIASSLSPPLTCSSMFLMSTPEIEQTQTNHPMRHISWYIPKSPIRHHKTSKKSKNIHESIKYTVSEVKMVYLFELSPYKIKAFWPSDPRMPGPRPCRLLR
jgi:hypothetical protein